MLLESPIEIESVLKTALLRDYVHPFTGTRQKFLRHKDLVLLLVFFWWKASEIMENAAEMRIAQGETICLLSKIPVLFRMGVKITAQFLKKMPIRRVVRTCFLVTHIQLNQQFLKQKNGMGVIVDGIPILDICKNLKAKLTQFLWFENRNEIVIPPQFKKTAFYVLFDTRPAKCDEHVFSRCLAYRTIRNRNAWIGYKCQRPVA